MKTLDVIYEDSDILVINKPSGVVVNRSDTTKGGKTLQDMVEEYLGSLLTVRSSQKNAPVIADNPNWESPEEAFVNRSGIVHRLDKETSGIMLVAKNVSAFANLQKQFKERVTQKTYLALAHGKIVPEVGVINVPVGRLTFNRKRFGIVAGGRESVTEYKVLRTVYVSLGSKKELFSLVELYPKTGRTHQIRVHLQYIGHPIFGDELYAGRKISRNDRKMLPRVFLHAAKISFTHPTTSQKNEIRSFTSKRAQSAGRRTVN